MDMESSRKRLDPAGRPLIAPTDCGSRWRERAHMPEGVRPLLPRGARLGPASFRRLSARPPRRDFCRERDSPSQQPAVGLEPGGGVLDAGPCRRPALEPFRADGLVTDLADPVAPYSEAGGGGGDLV